MARSRGPDGRWQRAFTEAQEAEIAEAYLTGEWSQEELGEKYGVQASTIHLVLKRQGVAAGRRWWRRSHRQIKCPACGEVRWKKQSDPRVYCSNTCGHTAPRPYRSREISDRELVLNIVGVALELGRIPTWAQVRERGRYSMGTYRRDGDGIQVWRERAGLTEQPGRKLTARWRAAARRALERGSAGEAT